MKKKIKILGVIALLLSLLAIRDYNNYFKGRSFINYHLLPYGLTPEYYKDYIIEDGKTVPIERFFLITEKSEFIGTGSSIPMNSPSTFTIDTIKCYYYNKDSIYVFIIDEENKPHWIIPIREKDGCVVFIEIKKDQINNLAKYKCVSNFYDSK